MKSEELKNAKQPPQIFYARHMQPGICKYEDEIVLVDTEALKKMIPTGATIPVYVNHQKVDVGKIKEQASGYITESFYNELDGWAWFKGIIVDDDGHEALNNKWAVSNAYIGDEFANGGTKNNCPYDREILSGRFTHLAIVEHPRYEEACIMSPDEFKAHQESLKRQLTELQNSKQPVEEKPMFKLFKNTKEEVSQIDDETMVDLGEGKSISFKEMVNSVKKKNANPNPQDLEPEMTNGDTEVDVDGEKMPLKELVNRYNAMMVKKNAADEADKAKEIEQKNAADEEEKAKKAKEKDEEKENSKYFEELRNAHESIAKNPVRVEAPQNGILRGKQRY